MTPPGMLEGLRVLDLGQHTREVLEELGTPGSEIDRLAAAAAIQLGPPG